MSIESRVNALKQELSQGVALVAVSKTKPVDAVMEAYRAGQRVFGENKVQELVSKWEALPKDISWHFIGHLQTNKVKYIVPFVDLIHSIDSLKLMQEIDRQAGKQNRQVRGLLQVHIAQEETKYGFLDSQLEEALSHEFKNLKIVGLMGMASNTADMKQVRSEFLGLNTRYKSIKAKFPTLQILSMGMSADYRLALGCGSTMVRLGSTIFGDRN